jgi:uncharacterized membrane protein YozB (DUF420 family)
MYSIFFMATLSLVAQIVTLFMITYGYILKRKSKFLTHATLMFAALLVHFSAFLLLMIPAFLSLYNNGFIQKLTWLSLTTFTHATLGGVTLISAIYLVGVWHFQASTRNCIKRRLLMRYVFVLWILSLILGVAIYALLYLHL